MSEQPEALRLAYWLKNAVQTYPQMSEDEPGGYYTQIDQVMDESAAELLRLHALCEEMGEVLEGLCGALEELEINDEALAKWKKSR